MLREVMLISVLYLGYSVSRLFADHDPERADDTARRIASLEGRFALSIEHPVNNLLSGHLGLGLAASYWYATAHYVVTPVVLILLWRSGRARYRAVRNVLALVTGVGLVMYLVLPTAPPRLMPGFHDVLAETSSWGWWGADASAPRGLGATTNELAAMPSLHVGWSVWCALSIGLILHRRWQRALLWLYPITTALVVVATGNHWLLDAVVGAAMVVGTHRLIGWLTLVPQAPTGPARTGAGAARRGTPHRTAAPDAGRWADPPPLLVEAAQGGAPSDGVRSDLTNKLTSSECGGTP